MQIIYLILAAAIVYAAYLGMIRFPITYNESFKARYGRPAWSVWASAITFALGVAAWYEYGDGVAFTVLVTLAVISAVLSLLLCYIRARKVGASRGEALLALLAQILSVAVVILIIIIAIGLKKLFDRKRR